MQHHAGSRRSAVRPVAEDGRAAAGEVHADLMHPASTGFRFDQREAAGLVEGPEIRDRAVPAGAHAYARDVPTATIELLDTGHFALEEEADAIAAAVAGVMTATFSIQR